jgi:hypothetical protein
MIAPGPKGLRGGNCRGCPQWIQSVTNSIGDFAIGGPLLTLMIAGTVSGQPSWISIMNSISRNTGVMSLPVLLVLFLTACAAAPDSKQAGLPSSQMIESSDLGDVRQSAEQLARLVGKDQVLVIYDLDNTLLAMEQDLGSDQWYYWQKQLKDADRCDPRVVASLLSAQGALYFASAMRPTQSDGPAIVRSLQDQGFKSIIITSRGPEFAAVSFRELRRNGFDFRASAIGPSRSDAIEFKPEADSRNTRYEDGVHLTAGQNKGEMLLALLGQSETPLPRAIVMADDKAENLQHVLDALAGRESTVQAFRYSREDPVVAAFDETQAADQWHLVEPALLQLQKVFGPDHFRLPEPARPEGCPE